MIRFGIDLGGTKIEIVALASDGRELLRRRIATPHEDYGGILGAIAMLVRDAVGSSGNSTTPRESTRGCHIGRPSPAAASLTVELAPSATTACA